MSLSPLTRSRLLAHAAVGFTSYEMADTEWARKYKRYACSFCGGVYHQERDAEYCCPRTVDVVFVSPSGEEFNSAEELASSMEGEESAPACPVCSNPYTDAWQAVDCCLWKDIEAPTRWRIAASVEQGTSWLDAITTHTKD